MQEDNQRPGRLAGRRRVASVGAGGGQPQVSDLIVALRSAAPGQGDARSWSEFRSAALCFFPPFRLRWSAGVLPGPPGAAGSSAARALGVETRLQGIFSYDTHTVRTMVGSFIPAKTSTTRLCQ